MPPIEILAYIAGIVDGEGCIQFSRHPYGRRRLLPRVLIVNTNLALLQFIQGHCGGNISQQSRKNINWKPSWQWRLSGMKAVAFLESIQPYIRIKKHQILVIFCWSATRPGYSRKTNNQITECDDVQLMLAEQMTFLNARGTQPLRQSPIDKILSEMEIAICH